MKLEITENIIIINTYLQRKNNGFFSSFNELFSSFDEQQVMKK